MTIRKLIGSREAKVIGSRRFWGAMLVTLLVATQATGGDRADQLQTHTTSKGTLMDSRHVEPQKIHGYAPVNGLKMYYEIEGTGDPLVYLPPVFGFAGLHSFPALSGQYPLRGDFRHSGLVDRAGEYAG